MSNENKKTFIVPNFIAVWAFLILAGIFVISLILAYGKRGLPGIFVALILWFFTLGFLVVSISTIEDEKEKRED